MPNTNGSKDSAGHESVEKLATLFSDSFGGEYGSVTPPIVQSSLFTFDSYEAFEDRMASRSDKAIYTRVQNPTVAAFESTMAKAEGAQASVAFASGMGAIAATMLSLLKPGDKVACVTHVYPDAYRLFERILRPFGINTSYHTPEEFNSNADLLKGVTVAYLESPNSLMFESLDLTVVASNAKRHSAISVIDNSWATPVFQRPLEHGIDISLHSASKYISGHSDTVAGVVVSSEELIHKIRDLTLPLLGAKLAPFEAFLLTRGLRTLVPRMQRHELTTNQLIERLQNHSSVECVRTAEINPASGVSGRSGLFSAQFQPSVDIRTFCNELKLFRLGVSWGGFESLALPARVALAQAEAENSMQRFGVPDNLVRFSVGLEGVEDLWEDLSTAMAASIR
ncbi:MAG: aminotransferase class I/II-fold pyridoxal phosphate-dependent enzyme [Granulosicoccus sp.]